jgi:hypothetical protein
MNRQSGIASFKAIVAVLLFVALVFLAVKLVPPYINNYQFTEDIETIARLATYAQGRSEDDIRQDVLGKAKELDLPVRPEDVSVAKSTYGVNINVKYNVRVEVPGHVFNLNFNPVAGNKMLTAK